jgi:hypothetical protein
MTDDRLAFTLADERKHHKITYEVVRNTLDGVRGYCECGEYSGIDQSGWKCTYALLLDRIDAALAPDPRPAARIDDEAGLAAASANRMAALYTDLRDVVLAATRTPMMTWLVEYGPEKAWEEAMDVVQSAVSDHGEAPHD